MSTVPVVKPIVLDGAMLTSLLGKPPITVEHL
jgi:hypothetical protein